MAVEALESGYPVTLAVDRPPTQSRITNFPLFIGTFIRSVLLIPHFLILYFFQIAGSITYFIATFAILFSGRYPEGLWRFYLGYLRWYHRAVGYLLHLYDNYPPFSPEPEPEYPLRLDAPYPPTSSRLLNFPFLALVIKSILLIPHLLVLTFLFIAELIIVFIALFAVLFSGAFPEGMHRFVVGVNRWSARVSAYLFGVTDKYPPFSLS